MHLMRFLSLLFSLFSISSFSLRCSTHCWQKHCYKYSIIRNIFTIIANPVINFFSKRILFLLQSIRFSSPFAHFSWDLCSFRAHKSYQKLRAAERGLQSLEKWNLMFKLINQWNETIRVDNSTDKNKNGRNKFTWIDWTPELICDHSQKRRTNIIIIFDAVSLSISMLTAIRWNLFSPRCLSWIPTFVG